MTAEERAQKTPSEMLDYYSGRLVFNMTLLANGERIQYGAARLAKWARGATHAVYQMHPELREENSLPRYFVAKAGRKMGFRGEELTWFVEQAYERGMASRFIPESSMSGLIR